MSDSTVQTVQNVSLAVGTTSGIMNVISQNATAISVLCTVGFGMVYVSCAIWNAYSNHKRNKITEETITRKVLEKIKDPELRARIETELEE